MSTGARTSALLLVRDRARVERLTEALSRQGITVVAEAGDADSALRLIDEQGPGVLVVDLGFAGDESLDFVTEARARAPRLKVIVLAESLDPQLVAKAAAQGVDAYVLDSKL